MPSRIFYQLTDTTLELARDQFRWKYKVVVTQLHKYVQPDWAREGNMNDTLNEVSDGSRAEMHEIPPSLDHLLELAHSVGAQAERKSDEAERNRRTDDTVVYALIDSGLMKVLRPVRFGGYESGFPAFVRVGQILAHYDVSVAWLYGIIGVHHWWGAYAEPRLQDELWRDNRTACS